MLNKEKLLLVKAIRVERLSDVAVGELINSGNQLERKFEISIERRMFVSENKKEVDDRITRLKRVPSISASVFSSNIVWQIMGQNGI